MLTILHGSDLHFGWAYHPRVGEAFVKAARSFSADLVIISGDLTQRAKVHEYQAAREFLARLQKAPLVVTPGNHDVPLYRVFERIFDPYRNYRRYISPELDTVTRIPGAVVVALNTAAPHRAITNGRIRPQQLEMAARVFRDAAPDEVKMLVSHHHFAPAPDYEGDKQLPGAKRILDRLSSLGVELIFGGHLHRAYIGNSLDVYPGKDRRHGVVIVQSGTTTSRRGRAREVAKNSFNVVRIARAHLEVTHYMYFEDVDRFAPFSMHAFPRRNDQYFAEDPFHPGATACDHLQKASGARQAVPATPGEGAA